MASSEHRLKSVPLLPSTHQPTVAQASEAAEEATKPLADARGSDSAPHVYSAFRVSSREAAVERTLFQRPLQPVRPFQQPLKTRPPRRLSVRADLALFRLFRHPRRERKQRQDAGNVQFPALSVFFETGCADVQQRGQRQPHLPMRKKSGERELAGQAHIGGKPPESKDIRHQRDRHQKGAERQRNMSILSRLALNRPALLKPDP
jgi:hypothetical protein